MCADSEEFNEKSKELENSFARLLVYSHFRSESITDGADAEQDCEEPFTLYTEL